MNQQRFRLQEQSAALIQRAVDFSGDLLDDSVIAALIEDSTYGRITNVRLGRVGDRLVHLDFETTLPHNRAQTRLRLWEEFELPKAINEAYIPDPALM